jgi:hypothetical protein
MTREKPVIPPLPPVSGAGPKGPAPYPADRLDLDSMSVPQLLKLHMEIDARLPARSLKDVSLERTLVLQLLNAQELQREVMDDSEATPTQRAQVTNTLSGVIDTLSKLQIKLFSSERMKEIEGCLIDTINALMTEEQAAFFFKEYRRRLGAMEVE